MGRLVVGWNVPKLSDAEVRVVVARVVDVLGMEWDEQWWERELAKAEGPQAAAPGREGK